MVSQDRQTRNEYLMYRTEQQNHGVQFALSEQMIIYAKRVDPGDD